MNLRKKFYLSLAIVLALSLVFVLIIYSLFKIIEKSSQELISQRERLALLESKMENLNQLENLYREVGPHLTRLDTIFINPEMPLSLIRFLEGISQETNSKIEIYPLAQAKRKEEFWNSQIFQIRIQDSFPDLLKFLEKLENGPFLTQIENLEIKKLSEKTEEVEANFNLKAFSK